MTTSGSFRVVRTGQREPYPEVRKVFIASHRRSGTHLLMNFIFNHFSESNISVKKINHLAADDALGCECLNGMFTSGRVIYIERNFESVLESMFHYMRAFTNDYAITRETSLAEFLQNENLVLDIAWTWFHTRRTWLQYVKSGQVLLVRFEEVLNQPDKSMEKLSKFLGLSPKLRVHKRTAGVLVGAGIGLVDPGTNVRETAQWALEAVKSRSVSNTRYGRSWNGITYIGRYPMRCHGTIASISACPAIWRNGESINVTRSL